MTYSVQFRKKVLKLQSEGESFIKLSKRFKISTTTISRWKKEINPKLIRNKRPIKIDNEILKKDINDYPDSYSYERARRLGVSTSGIKHAKKRMGITYKKNSKSSESRFRKKIYVLPKN
jgi:transposase